MKKIFFLLVCIITFSLCLKAQILDTAKDNIDGVCLVQDTLKQGRLLTVSDADSAYINADYLTAIHIYEEVLHNCGYSALLYMNLGNAYYKIDEIAKAILCYERAYLLDPSDANIKFNLELARTKTVDRVNPKNQLFIVVWADEFISLLNVDQWAKLVIVFLIIALFETGLYFFSKKVTVKKISFYLLSLFFVFSLLSYIFAATEMNNLKHRGTAIIMSPSVTVRSTPSENGTELFIIHEGRKVKILDDSMKEWVEIELEDGNTGWIENKLMEVI